MCSPSKYKENLDGRIFIDCWSIWKFRNARVFRGEEDPVLVIKNVILVRLGWWDHGWKHLYPFYLVIVKPMFLQSVLLGRRQVRTREAFDNWEALGEGGLKWKTNATLVRNTKNTIGGASLEVSYVACPSAHARYKTLIMRRSLPFFALNISCRKGWFVERLY